RRVDAHATRTIVARLRPEIVPAPLWKIDRPGGCACARDRRYEQVIAPEVLAPQLPGLGVVRIVHDERAHEGEPEATCLPGKRVGVGEETVAQLGVVAAERSTG